MTLTPDPFASNFSQTLILNDGYVSITGQDGIALKLWVDALNPVIHAEINGSSPFSLTASYESWRYEDRTLGDNGTVYEQGNNCYHFSRHSLLNLIDQSSWDQLPHANAITKADNISFSHGGVLMSHRNYNNSVFEYTLKEQHLDQYQDTMYNPILNNTVSTLEVKSSFPSLTFQVCYVDV